MAPDFSETDLFEVLEPDVQRIPLVLNSPHSGRRYTQDFLDQSRLDALAIRRSEDHYVDELFSSGVDLGAPMLRAHFPRAFLDVNREPYELDPRMFRDPLPEHFNTNSPRIAAGLGTIARIVSESRPIYREQLSLEDALMRIEGIYKPYHKTLQTLLSETVARFGVAVLIDCHSMPRLNRGNDRSAPDVVLGDRYGTSASADLTRTAMHLLQDMGFVVIRNKPYAGGFITEHYGRPAKGLHALQIEVNRGLYVDEATLARKPDFAKLKHALSTFLAQFSDHVDTFAEETALAAE